MQPSDRIDSNVAKRHHYDQRSKETREQRAKSAAIRLRRANNRVKSLLIESALRNAVDRVGLDNDQVRPARPIFVLDLGCGKGGDLPKWGAIADALNCTVHYYGIDLSPKSIAELHRRVSEARRLNRWSNLRVEAVVGDMCRVDTADFGNDWPTVDIVSAQFSLHYGFDSIANCRALFDNIGRFLALDGQMIMTLVDDATLKLRICTEPRIEVDSDNSACAVSFGNNIYSCRMPVDDLRRLAAPQRLVGACGIRYTFWLDSCVEHCDEYVVEKDFLLCMLRQIGLQLTCYKKFDQIDCGEQLSDDERQIYSLYAAIVCCK